MSSLRCSPTLPLRTFAESLPGGSPIDALAAFAHQPVVEAVLVRQHEFQRRLTADDIEQRIVEFDADEARDSAHRRFEIARSSARTTASARSGCCAAPTTTQVVPVVAARAGLQVFLRAAFDRHAAGLEEPALHEAERRDERVFRIADRQQVAGAFRHQVVRQMALEAARLPRCGASRSRPRSCAVSIHGTTREMSSKSMSPRVRKP